jgi:hypothetical protein
MIKKKIRKEDIYNDRRFFLRDQTTDMSLYANTAYSMFPNATARNNF